MEERWEMKSKRFVSIFSFILITNFLVFNVFFAVANSNIQFSENEDENTLWAYDNFKNTISPESGLIDDINNDGINDILVGTHDHGLYLLNTEGNIIWNYNGIVDGIYSIFSYDLNNDGIKEILFPSSYNYLTVLNSNGSVLLQVS